MFRSLRVLIDENKKQMIDEEKIADLGERIAREFQPERIILFGSHAYGNPRPDSDVDLLVVLPFEGKGFRKSLEILNRVDPDFPVDLVARRPEDTARPVRGRRPLDPRGSGPRKGAL